VRRALAVLLSLGAIGQLGGSCSGDGSGGSPPKLEIRSPDPRCVALPDAFGFPPGFAFVPGVPGRVLAATFSRPTLIPLDVNARPFGAPVGATPYELPADSDGDGVAEFVQFIDDVFALAPDLALVTLSGFEAVLFVAPDGGPRVVELETPAALPAHVLEGWPSPGAAPEARMGLQNGICFVPPSGALDSRGERLVDVLDPADYCEPGIASFRAVFTAGAAVAAGHLFVVSSNVGVGSNGENTQYLPGAVSVYELDLAVAPPRLRPSLATPNGRPIIASSAGHYNPTHISAYTTPGGREYVLVTLTGPIGIRADDPNTSAAEGGAVSLGDGGIDVIDAASLSLVAHIPLRGANPSFRGLAIDPTGRIGIVGDVNARRLYAVDLAPLESLVPRPGDVIALDGSEGPNSVIFDGLTPFEIPALPAGAPAVTCPGQIESVAFNHAGDLALAIDSCDGSLALVDVDLVRAPGPPLPRDRFAFRSLLGVTAPIRPEAVGLPRLPSDLAVRPGVPGEDYTGPDVFFLVGREEGLLCGLHIESPAP